MANYSSDQIIVSCEHGGREIPADFAALFAAGDGVLDSHRAWDAGSAELAEQLGVALRVQPVIARVTRLLVDLNRSPGHPRQFSEFSRAQSSEVREEILQNYYRPHRERVERMVGEAVRASGRALHISVHSFTPSLNGEARRADVGLLYDPKRATECQLCEHWGKTLRGSRPDLIIRRNYPYRGVSDGLTTFLRKRFSNCRYQGIELEVNQSWTDGSPETWRGLARWLAAASRTALLGR